MKTTSNKTETTISNSFTGYEAMIRTAGLPAVSTIRKHLRASRASDCQSTTAIECDGVPHDLVDRGHGLELVPNR